MLPIPTVARETGHLTRGDGADLAETNIGDHSVKAFPRDTAGGGAAKIFIDRLDPAPTQIRQPFPHSVLQSAAFPVVQNLVGR